MFAGLASGGGHRDLASLIEALSSLLQWGMIIESEAHIDQPDVVGAMDPLHATEEVGEIAKAILIEHLHRH